MRSRFVVSSLLAMVRMGTGSAVPVRRAPCATVPRVMLVETSWMSGSPAALPPAETSYGMWQVTHVGARLGSPPGRLLSVP